MIKPDYKLKYKDLKLYKEELKRYKMLNEIWEAVKMNPYTDLEILTLAEMNNKLKKKKRGKYNG